MTWKMPAWRIVSFAVSEIRSRLPGHHGGGDGARIAPDDGVDAAGERVARAVDRHAGGEPKTRRLRRLRCLDAAEHAADGADPGEIGVARKVVAAGRRGTRGRQQACLHLDEGAGLEIGRAAASSAAPDRAAGRRARRWLRRAARSARPRDESPSPRSSPARWRCAGDRAPVPRPAPCASPAAAMPVSTAAAVTRTMKLRRCARASAARPARAKARMVVSQTSGSWSAEK